MISILSIDRTRFIIVIFIIIFFFYLLITYGVCKKEKVLFFLVRFTAASGPREQR